MVLNEVLLMQSRLFSLFCQRCNIEHKKANTIFSDFGIWDHIENCCDILHMDGNEVIYEDILAMLRKRSHHTMTLKDGMLL